jgi:uncharacterized membrane protein YkvA (DUF1232 family)
MDENNNNRTKRIMDALASLYKKAQENDKVNDYVDEAEKKASDEEKTSKAVALINNVKTCIAIVKDYFKGDYKEIPYKTLASIIGAVIYFAAPIDIIPDSFLGGYLDDVMVMNAVFTAAAIDIANYKSWKEKQDDVVDATVVKDVPTEEALKWCRDNAPEALKDCSDEEVWSYMKSSYDTLSGQTV